MKNYIIKSLTKVEDNDIEGYAVEFTPDTIAEETHKKLLEHIGNALECQGVGAWNNGKKAFMVFENTNDISDFKSKLDVLVTTILSLR